MRFPFLPRNAKFFDLFEESANNMERMALAFKDLVENYQDVPQKVARISALEHDADQVTHRIVEQLNLTFVTPLDREDIITLAQRLDDVIDHIEAAATAMQIYHVPQPNEVVHHLAGIILHMTSILKEAISHLRRSGQLKHIFEDARTVNELENAADQALRQAIEALFADSINPVDIIRWREVYQLLEQATDHGEDVANILEGIALKHA